MTNYSKKQKHSPLLLKPWPLALLGVLLIVGTLAVLEVTGTTHLFHKAVAKTAVITSTSPKQSGSTKPSTQPTTSGSGTSGSSSSTSSGSGSSGSASTTTPDTGATTKGSGDTTPAAPAPSGQAPAQPNGSFVSNHSPSSNSKDQTSQEASVCNTTPGATCGIVFTNGNLTRSLTTKPTDYDGSAYWNWNVGQAGLTQGTWTITVTATLNGQTATAHDTLKVGP